MRGCGPGCHCVRRMDNIREEALQGLVSDSIEKFMPCDILKDEFEALKKELTELREKAVGENKISTLAATANDNLSDVPALSAEAGSQAQRLEELVKIAGQLGVKMETAEKIVEAERVKKTVIVPAQAPQKKASGGNAP